MIILDQSKIGEISMGWLHDQIETIMPSHNRQLADAQSNYIVKVHFLSSSELDIEMVNGVRWTVELDDVYVSARLFDENGQLLAIGLPDSEQKDFEKQFAETIVHIIDERLG